MNTEIQKIENNIFLYLKGQIITWNLWFVLFIFIRNWTFTKLDSTVSFIIGVIIAISAIAYGIIAFKHSMLIKTIKKDPKLDSIINDEFSKDIEKSSAKFAFFSLLGATIFFTILSSIFTLSGQLFGELMILSGVNAYLISFIYKMKKAENE